MCFLSRSDHHGAVLLGTPIILNFSRTTSREKSKERNGSKISFTAMNEVQEYEKQSAIDEDRKLKMSKSSNSYKQLVRTISGVENNVIPMKK